MRNKSEFILSSKKVFIIFRNKMLVKISLNVLFKKQAMGYIHHLSLFGLLYIE